MAKSSATKLTAAAQQALLATLKQRFERKAGLVKGLSWPTVEARLTAHPAALWSLQQMEDTGGEPALMRWDASTGACMFADCSAESPAGRRSVCYDRDGLESRKEARPANSATDMAEAMGVRLMTEAEYLDLQALGDFDTKTSSWLLTPADLRAKGGAIFGDKRYGRVFVYHNGAQSYYAARGFRAVLWV